jgi:hypothetical protein
MAQLVMIPDGITDSDERMGLVENASDDRKTSLIRSHTSNYNEPGTALWKE